MTFGAPALLLGLLAVAAPIVIHLVNRRRANRVRFPALEFLVRSNRRMARRLKLKQLALLASRVAFFVFVPLAMARPSTRCGAGSGESASTNRLPASVVFVVDDSGSMSTPTGGGTRWDAAVADATRRARALRPWDTAALVIASAEPRRLVGAFTEERSEVVSALRDHVPAFGSSDLGAALLAAADIQAASRLPVRRTVVISDGTVAAWPDRIDDIPVADLGSLEIVSVSDGSSSNVAVTGLRYARADSGGEGEYRIDADVRSWGESAPSTVTATLRVDGAAVGSSLVELGPSGEGVVGFQHALSGGGSVTIDVTLSGATGATADDVRTVPMQPDRAVRVLLVNGDPRAVALNDEVFFLARALDLSVDGRREIEPTVAAADQFADTDLDGYDAVVLANVAALPVPQVARLRAFVEQGGGVLFAAGGTVEPDRWNSLFGPLLPKPVRSVKVLAEPGDPDAGILATRVTEIDARHPVGRVFALRGGESMRSALVYRYLLLEPAPDSDAEIIAAFADGGPALLERRLGRGRVMLWTTSVDLDWTDLPLTTSFVPLVRRLAEYLARRSAGAQDQVSVGERVVLPVDALRPDTVIVQAPDGARHVLAAEAGRVVFVPDVRGVHRVAAVTEGVETPAPALDFAVNAPLAESDPAAITPDLIAALERRAQERVADGGTGPVGEGTSAWPLLLMLGLLALYLESLLAVRRRLWSRLAGWFGRRRVGEAP